MTNFSSNNRRALTLIEMLIGMAITLVMMAAVVNLFANISQGVRNRRATMEISADLRIARTQLFNDLAGATCLKYPKNAHGVMPKPDSNNPPDGYFEIVEGTYSDDNPYAPGSIDRTTSLVPSSSAAFDAQGNPVVLGEYTDGGGLGDYDDILAMTVENEVEKFRGKGRGLTPGGDPTTIAGGPSGTGDWIDMAISSPVAEVIWYSVQTPLRTDPSYRPEMGEPGMRKIYRRTLLVVPWYGTEVNKVSGISGSDPLLDLSDPALYPTFASRLKALRDFQNKYDISARLENQRIVPNTVADLARREHRFAHMTNPADYPLTSPGYFPYQFPYDTQGAPPNADFQEPGADNSSLYPFGSDNQPGDLPTNERSNEDLVLSDVLAFDIQVFDPGAPLYQYEGAIIQPSGTPGGPFLNAIGTGVITGFGTYVDLGWNNVPGYDYTAITGAPPTLFQQERQVGWHPRAPGYFNSSPSTYDTWTTYYETDGVDQDNRDNDGNVLTGADEGTNGLDDPDASLAGDPRYVDVAGDIPINGPDDPLERETSPPYPSPLLGVQVKLRVYEPESRQIRETTVTRNLAK